MCSQLESSWARRRVAPVELAEVTRRKDADKQRAQAEGEDVACGLRIESADVRDEQKRNHRVEKSPNDVDSCGGEPFARRFCKRTLKGTSVIPETKWGMAFAAKAPPKKYDTSESQFMMQVLLFSKQIWDERGWVYSSTSRVSSASDFRSCSCS